MLNYPGLAHLAAYFGEQVIIDHKNAVILYRRVEGVLSEADL